MRRTGGVILHFRRNYLAACNTLAIARFGSKRTGVTKRGLWNARDGCRTGPTVSPRTARLRRPSRGRARATRLVRARGRIRGHRCDSAARRDASASDQGELFGLEMTRRATNSFKSRGTARAHESDRRAVDHARATQSLTRAHRRPSPSRPPPASASPRSSGGRASRRRTASSTTRPTRRRRRAPKRPRRRTRRRARPSRPNSTVASRRPSSCSRRVRRATRRPPSGSRRP